MPVTSFIQWQTPLNQYCRTQLRLLCQEAMNNPGRLAHRGTGIAWGTPGVCRPWTMTSRYTISRCCCHAPAETQTPRNLPQACLQGRSRGRTPALSALSRRRRRAHLVSPVGSAGLGREVVKPQSWPEPRPQCGLEGDRGGVSTLLLTPA